MPSLRCHFRLCSSSSVASSFLLSFSTIFITLFSPLCSISLDHCFDYRRIVSWSRSSSLSKDISCFVRLSLFSLAVFFPLCKVSAFRSVKEIDGRKAANFEEKGPSFNDFGVDVEVKVNEEAPCEPQEYPRDVIDIDDVPPSFPPKLRGTMYSRKSSDDALNSRKGTSDANVPSDFLVKRFKIVASENSAPDGFKDNENVNAKVPVRCKNLSNQSSATPTTDYKNAKRMSPQAKLVGKDTFKPLILKEDVEDANRSKEARLSIEGVSLYWAKGLSILEYFREYIIRAFHGLGHANVGWFNDFLNTIFFSSPMVALIIVVFLDNTLDYKDNVKDRGMPWWTKFRTFKGDN
ncbi:hypothetical protein V8G54_032034 [Vigna mungo]|uniref:Uncharacterized protein n=1 Tax=Vigna mungo TaxID=3915 RepID=A0AAQ3ML75_VIGMU